MSSVSERILLRMKQLNLQQVDLIAATKSSKGTVSKWISGINTPSGKSITALAKALKTTPEWILEGEGLKSIEVSANTEKNEASNIRITDAKLTRVPVLDLVQAGHWREVAYDGYNPLGYDYTTYQGSDSNSLFMAIVDGMSMSPDYMPGDAVLVDAALAPKPGCLVLAQQVSQGMAETTFKKYRVIGFNENGCEVVELVPLNPDFPTYSSEQVDISIIGIVVEHRRRLKY